MKIYKLEELARKVQILKSEGKKIVLCHGCFDLMHPGHIKYFKAAKKMADILIVTVTPDIYVDKGPGRPVFNQNLRADSIAVLECVDYVAINSWPTAESTLRLLRPDIYVKGQEFENLEDKTGKLQNEYKVLKEIGAEMEFTHEIVFSSTELLNQHFNSHIQINTDKNPKSLIDSSAFESAKPEEKILQLEDLVKKVAELKQEGKIVVQSHGIFDLIHPGIVKHLQEAKGQGNILIVTVIKDKHVRRGPGRPVFPENFRAENVASLEQVDYVCTVDDENPFECVRMIKPDIFARGQAYKERDHTINRKIYDDEKELYFGRSRIYETQGFSFSSTSIINDFLDIYPVETKKFLEDFSKKYSFKYISEKLDRVKALKVLLLGDGIIDEYHYCESMGKSPKAQIVVNKYITHEVFAGGAFAIANHLAGLCDTVQLVTLLGKDDTREDFILNNLKPNVEPTFFYRDDGPTIVKKRYINQYQNQKVFEINYINDSYIKDECESDLLNYLRTTIPEYDLILVSDFGHGFITDKMIRTIEKISNKLAVNTQTNGANAGYNLITKYSSPQFICLDVPEARLATQDKVSEIEDVAEKMTKTLKTDYLIITLGSDGSIGINKDGGLNRTPAFSTKVVDITGAGDAFFAYTAPCFATGIPLDLVSFIGNAVGALAVQVVCNKKSIEKYELLEFIHTVLK